MNEREKAINTIREEVNRLLNGEDTNVNVNLLIENYAFLEVYNRNKDIPEYEEAKNLINSLKEKYPSYVGFINAMVHHEPIKFETREEFEERSKAEKNN